MCFSEVLLTSPACDPALKSGLDRHRGILQYSLIWCSVTTSDLSPVPFNLEIKPETCVFPLWPVYTTNIWGPCRSGLMAQPKIAVPRRSQRVTLFSLQGQHVVRYLFTAGHNLEQKCRTAPLICWFFAGKYSLNGFVTFVCRLNSESRLNLLFSFSLSGHNKSNFSMEPLKKGVNGQKGIEENLGHSRIQPALLLTSSQANVAAISSFRPRGPLAPRPLLKHQFRRLQNWCCSVCPFNSFNRAMKRCYLHSLSHSYLWMFSFK